MGVSKVGLTDVAASSNAMEAMAASSNASCVQHGLTVSAPQARMSRLRLAMPQVA